MTMFKGKYVLVQLNSSSPPGQSFFASHHLSSSTHFELGLSLQAMWNCGQVPRIVTGKYWICIKTYIELFFFIQVIWNIRHKEESKHKEEENLNFKTEVSKYRYKVET